MFAEVEPDEVNVFVRDRGAGFDPDAVPDDRHGLADSVRGRMARHGGSVRLRSRAGEGTEVHLRMPTAVAVVEEKEQPHERACERISVTATVGHRRPSEARERR